MKQISILGDSISTFAGVNPQGYSVYYDKDLQLRNGLNSVDDTWWAKVIHRMQGRLCVNDSYSGSRVTGEGFPAGASEKRIRNLRTEQHDPDIILIFMGLNDFAGGVELISSLDDFGFEDSYDFMLKTVKTIYPSADIVCGTLMRTVLRGRSVWQFPEYSAGAGFEQYNNSIRWVTQENQCYLADLCREDARYETLDGFHPTARGHAAIAGRWIECLGELGFLPPSPGLT
ncbi:MAG: SGNH/GDSL hydrolase family protein [Eubacteriales bacterium]|nr:SGNH/GDSL hydrolase family protein [Eubacteriales bacterium]